jgi:hypothetical protein
MRREATLARINSLPAVAAPGMLILLTSSRWKWQNRCEGQHTNGTDTAASGAFLSLYIPAQPQTCLVHIGFSETMTR